MSPNSDAASSAPGLLIAVVGPPGSGKTQLLAELASWQQARGGRVDGFLAATGSHRRRREGADHYRIHLLATGEDLPWAVRDESCHPPYRFEPATLARLQTWAAALPPETPLVLLDEFGRIEAGGEGLMVLWPDLLRARPGIVIMAVRAGAAAAIETQLGRPFDLRLVADAPDTPARLRQTCADFGEWTRLGIFGGAAGGVELTLGTALHATKLPLRGLVMSRLQAAMLVFASVGLSHPGRVIWVPFISAGLKAFAPGGSRLRPMLAIAVQGLLFGASVQVFGATVGGLVLGGLLVGAWSAAQGLLLQYLMLGGEMFRAYDTAVLWLARQTHLAAPGLPWLLAAWTLFHGLLGAAAALAALRLRQPPAALQRLIAREQPPLPGLDGTPAAPPPWWHRLREFGRWQFWLPLLVVSGILLAGGRSWATVGWLALRFLAVGALLLTAVSLLRPARWAGHLRRRGWWGPALAFAGALERRRATAPGPVPPP
jgi:nucleoside-triphosphatase THEP1